MEWIWIKLSFYCLGNFITEWEKRVWFYPPKLEWKKERSIWLNGMHSFMFHSISSYVKQCKKWNLILFCSFLLYFIILHKSKHSPIYGWDMLPCSFNFTVVLSKTLCTFIHGLRQDKKSLVCAVYFVWAMICTIYILYYSFLTFLNSYIIFYNY